MTENHEGHNYPAEEIDRIRKQWGEECLLEIVEEKQHENGSWFIGAWASCAGCAKNRYLYVRENTYEMAIAMIQMRSIFVCKCCSAKRAMDMDMCMHSVPTDGGVRACKLGFFHSGRCEPWVIEGVG